MVPLLFRNLTLKNQTKNKILIMRLILVGGAICRQQIERVYLSHKRLPHRIIPCPIRNIQKVSLLLQAEIRELELP